MEEGVCVLKLKLNWLFKRSIRGSSKGLCLALVLMERALVFVSFSLNNATNRDSQGQSYAADLSCLHEG